MIFLSQVKVILSDNFQKVESKYQLLVLFKKKKYQLLVIIHMMLDFVCSEAFSLFQFNCQRNEKTKKKAALHNTLQSRLVSNQVITRWSPSPTMSLMNVMCNVFLSHIERFFSKYVGSKNINIYLQQDHVRMNAPQTLFQRY